VPSDLDKWGLSRSDYPATKATPNLRLWSVAARAPALFPSVRFGDGLLEAVDGEDGPNG